MPHGHCFLWRPDLLWLHVGSDLAIVLAYYSIPLALVYFTKRRTDLHFRGLFLLFGLFIFLCGTTHLMDVWTTWSASYWIEGVVKAVTAAVSLITAVVLWPIVPKALSLPSPMQLQTANENLRQEVAERRKAETLFRKLLELAPDAMIAINAEGKIALLNSQAEQFFGYTRAELLGTPIEQLVPENFRERHRTHRSDYFEDPKARPMGAGMELRALRKDGSEFPVEISLSPIETDSERLVFSAIRDVTDRKRAEDALRGLNAELEHRVQKRTQELTSYARELRRSNEELAQFASVVSHDLKSPMRGISALVDWLLEDYSEVLDAEGREKLVLLHQRAQRMYNLIGGVLTYSRATHSSSQQRIDTEQLVSQVIDALAPPTSMRIAIAGNLPRVVYNETQLVQVFQNLIGNAVQHCGKASGEIRITARDAGDAYEFCVRDEGIGIDPVHHERIFRVFQRLSQETDSRSIGIGLAVVKKIVETSGGCIRLESTPQQGSAFYFTVPKREVTGSDTAIADSKKRDG